MPRELERWVSSIHPMMQHLANAIAGSQYDSTIRSTYEFSLQSSRNHLGGMNLLLFMATIHPKIDQTIQG
jgi:hypothetical protein